MECYPPMENMCEVLLEESNEPMDMDLPPVPTFDFDLHASFFPEPEISPPPPPPPPRPRSSGILKKPSLVLSRFDDNSPLKGFKKISFPEPDKSRDFATKLLGHDRSFIAHSEPDGFKKDLMVTSKEELKYFTDLFKDIEQVNNCKLHCTICNKHLGSSFKSASESKSHRILAVLVCKDCYEFYGDGKFPTDKTDNTEIYCRWCGQGGAQFCCSFCPRVFCLKCVKRNFGKPYHDMIDKANDWACFFCAQEPLWPLRAISRALFMYLSTCPPVDQSLCCHGTAKAKPPLNAPIYRILASPTPPKPLKPILPATVRLPLLSPKILLPKPAFSMRQPHRLLYPPPPLAPAPRTQPAILSKPQFLRTYPPPMPVMNRSPPVYPRPPVRGMDNEPPGVVSSSADIQRKALNVPKVDLDHTKQNTMLVRLRMPNKTEQFLQVNIRGNCLTIPPIEKKDTLPAHAIKQFFNVTKKVFTRFTTLNTDIGADNAGTGREQTQTILANIKSFKTILTQLESDISKNMSKLIKEESDDTVIVLDEDEEPFTWNYQKKMADLFPEESEIEIIEDDSPSRKRKLADSSPEIIETQTKKLKLTNGVGAKRSPRLSVKPGLIETPPSTGKSRKKIQEDDALTDRKEPEVGASPKSKGGKKATQKPVEESLEEGEVEETAAPKKQRKSRARPASKKGGGKKAKKEDSDEEDDVVVEDEDTKDGDEDVYAEDSEADVADDPLAIS